MAIKYPVSHKGGDPDQDVSMPRFGNNETSAWYAPRALLEVVSGLFVLRLLAWLEGSRATAR